MTIAAALQRELLLARRGGERAVAAALRTALAGLANAEAVPQADPPAVPEAGAGLEDADEHVAGSRQGVGAAEAERRHVGAAEQEALVRGEIDDLRAAAAAYDALDPRRAADARAGAAVLERVLAETG